MSSSAAAPPVPSLAGVYSWRALPRRVGYLLLGLVWSLSLGLAVVVLVAVGVPLSLIAVGVPVLLAGLSLARAYGALELALLRWTRMPTVTPPTWRTEKADTIGTWLWRRLSSPDAWRAALFAAVTLLLTPVTWALTLLFSVLTVAFPAMLVQVYLIPSLMYDDAESQSLGELLFSLMTPAEQAQWRIGPHGLDLLIGGVGSVIGLALLPLVAGACVHLHHAIARGLLARRTSDALRAQVVELSSARRAATQAEGRTLRQLERDLHDGPQQQLLRLQLDLEAAQRRLESDPDGAGDLLADARTRTRDTLSELRRLSRGIAPPLLQDRGLAEAVAALAERSPIPATVDLGDGTGPDGLGGDDVGDGLDPAVAQAAYFVVSELLANAAKHSGAEHVVVALGRVIGADGGDGAELAELLVVEVSDDGAGGAVLVPGGGLDGLAERLRGLGGTLSVSSPDGGPTRVRAVVPLAA